MISKMLVDSYQTLTEISLWLLFLLAAIMGYSIGGMGSAGGGVLGAIISIIGAFIFAVLFVAPFMVIGDIRNRLKTIEEIAKSKQDS